MSKLHVTVSVVGLAVAAGMHPLAAETPSFDRAGRIILAQAPATNPNDPDPKKAQGNKGQGRGQGNGQGQGQGGRRPPDAGGAPPPARGPNARQASPQQTPPPVKPSILQPRPATPPPPVVPRQVAPTPPPPPVKPSILQPLPPRQAAPTPPPPPVAPRQAAPTPPPPPVVPRQAAPMPPPPPVAPRQATPPLPTGRPAAQSGFLKPVAPAGKFEDLKRSRQVTNPTGNRTVIVEPGNRTIIRENNRVVIRHDEGARFRSFVPGARTVPRRGGGQETFFIRPDGVRVVTLTDRSGRIVERYRLLPGGRRESIIDNRRFYRNAAAIGLGAVGVGVALSLLAPRVAIARDRYIVDYARASDDDLYETLMAPPVERLDRAYSLDEVRYNVQLRDRMRRIDLDAVTFEFGSYTVTPEQYGKLARIARAINRVVDRNPSEVFLIEGHTDAVGEDIDNLSLSDRRAEAVADVLAREFNVPIENMITQGYGEQFLKVDTSGPERVNRRVAVRRVTPLMEEASR